jgi:hypothetical protein
MTPIDRHNQRVRDAMKVHGLTEVIKGVYSDGTIRDGKMAVVHVAVKPVATEAEIASECASAAARFQDAINPARGPSGA